MYIECVQPAFCGCLCKVASRTAGPLDCLFEYDGFLFRRDFSDRITIVKIVLHPPIIVHSDDRKTDIMRISERRIRRYKDTQKSKLLMCSSGLRDSWVRIRFGVEFAGVDMEVFCLRGNENGGLI